MWFSFYVVQVFVCRYYVLIIFHSGSHCFLHPNLKHWLGHVQCMAYHLYIHVLFNSKHFLPGKNPNFSSSEWKYLNDVKAYVMWTISHFVNFLYSGIPWRDPSKLPTVKFYQNHENLYITYTILIQYLYSTYTVRIVLICSYYMQSAHFCDFNALFLNLPLIWRQKAL